MAIVFEHFPKNSLDRVAWDVNLFFGFLGLSKMASFRHKNQFTGSEAENTATTSRESRIS